MGGSCRFLVYPVFCWWLFAFVRDRLVSWFPPSFVDHCVCTRHALRFGVPCLLLTTVCICTWHALRFGVPCLLLTTVCICTWYAFLWLGVPCLLLTTVCICTWHALLWLGVPPVFCWSLFVFVRDMLVSWCPPSFIDQYLHLYVTCWCLGVPRLLLITICKWHTLLWLGVPQSFVDHYLHL